MKTKLLFLLLITSTLLISCADDKYNGPLYKIEVTYTEELYRQKDTLIVGGLDPTVYSDGKTRLYDALNDITTEPIDSFRILKRIPSRFNNETLAIEYYNEKNKEEAKEKVEERDKDKWWNK